ncbi:hypothetical protein [Streptomyces poriticola]|uniref:hypothetical protein n=1 Tax=Streptomyces poriticola TaxID=3120506 RepID=UPI002FCE2B40
MSGSGSGSGSSGPPDEQDGTSSVPDDVWHKFLTDSEHAIRSSAPREPAARERATGRHPEPAPPDPAPWAADRNRSPGSTHSTHDTHDASAAVGEWWQPAAPSTGPAWRELDGRARLRRLGRLAATAAAVTLAVTAWSQLTTGPGTPAVVPDGSTVERVEEAPVGVPTAASPSAGSPHAVTPAAVVPGPSASVTVAQ